MTGRSTRGIPKPPHDALERRRDKVVEYTLAKYPTEDIARALGVSKTTIAADRHARRRDLEIAGHVRAAVHSRRPDGLPPPYDWLSAPPRAGQAPYAAVLPVRVIRGQLRILRENNSRNRLAHAVAAARQAGDDAFLASTRHLLAEAVSYLQEMLGILESEEATQRAATTTAGRDDLTTSVVRGSQPLPPRGGGTLPGKVYAEVWRYRWAGIPVTPQVADHLGALTNTASRRFLEADAALEAAEG